MPLMKNAVLERFNDLKQRESFRKILKSFQYLSSERLIKLVVGIIVHAWLARFLGPEKFGRLSYITNFTSIFLPFVIFGLDDVLTKHFLQKKYDPRDVVTSQIQIRLYFGVIGFAILAAIVILDPSFELNYKLMILIFGLTLFLRVFDVIESFYQSFLNLKPVFWSRNISYLSSSAMKIAGVIFKSNLSFFLFTYLWEVFSWKVISVYTYFRNYRFGRVNKEYSKLFLKEGFPLFWGAFIIMIDSKLGNITLKKYHGDESVGNFSIVMILIELWAFLPAAICASLYPAVFNSKMGMSGAYKNRLQLLYDILFWLGISFAASVTILSPWIVNVLYGSKFPELPNLLAISSWVAILTFLNFGRIKYYTLENKLRLWLVYSLISLLINCAMQIKLVSTYQEKGAIISMITAPLISLIICSFFSSFVRNEVMLISRCLFAPIRIFRNRIID